jgi:xylulokinase
MKKELIISYDLGTTGNKATVFDFNGNLIASSFRSYETYYPKPGWAEQKQQDWWQSIKDSSRELFEKAPHSKDNLAAVTFSGQMMGCCPIDREGNPLLNAIIWSDQRAYLEKELLKEKITDEFAYKNTGNVVCANYLAAKSMWLKKNFPDVYKKTYKFLQAKDYIAYKLTGNTFTDYSDGSGTNLFDINLKKWNKDMIAAAGIPEEKLPEIVPSTTIIGKVKKDIAEITSLPAGLPVVIGGGDGPCATVGAGASSPDSCYNIFGSSAWTSVTTSKPLFDRSMRIFILNHLDPDLYMSVGTMQSAGASFEWLAEWLGDCERSVCGYTGKSIYELMDEIGMKANAGSNGVIFLPYLMGERAPYWDTEVKGAFLGITRVTGKKEIIRAVLEGIVYHLKLILEILEENIGNITDIRLIGGGGKSRFLQQLMADIWGKKIIPMKYMEEATSIGAAIAALVAIGAKKSFYDAEGFLKNTGFIEPDFEKNRIYDKFYMIFKDAYKDLKSINSRLDRLIKN